MPLKEEACLEEVLLEVAVILGQVRTLGEAFLEEACLGQQRKRLELGHSLGEAFILVEGHSLEEAFVPELGHNLEGAFVLEQVRTLEVASVLEEASLIEPPLAKVEVEKL